MRAPPLWLFRLVAALAGWLATLRRRLLPPHFAAVEIGTMSWVSQSTAAFCALGLPQALAGGAKSARELAAQGFGDEAMLFRLLRALAAYDVTRYAGRARFELGHAGKGLAGPFSAAPMVLYANVPWHVQGYAHLSDGVRSARSGFEIAHGVPMFEFLRRNPEAGALFDGAMQSLTPMFADAFARAYDFSRFEHVVDVGGGTGVLLARVLQRFPRVRGTVFELPPVAVRARERAAGERLSVAEGDVFTDAPPPAGAYILSHVLHEWDDDSCARSLRNVRRAMPPGACVLVYEIVARPPDNRWSQDRLTDLEMMAMLPGRERTREEFAALFERGGLRLRRVVAAAAPESILEAVAAAPE